MSSSFPLAIATLMSAKQILMNILHPNGNHYYLSVKRTWLVHTSKNTAGEKIFFFFLNSLGKYLFNMENVLKKGSSIRIEYDKR